MKKPMQLLLGVACLLLFACNQHTAEQSTDQTSQDPVNTVPFTDSAGAPVTAAAAGSPDWDRKLIKTAKLVYRVPDCPDFQHRVHETVSRYGGYIASEHQSQRADRKEITVTLKVPVQYFDRVLLELPDSSVITESRTVSTEDVSAEVVDVQARVAAKKEMRQRYLEFFRQAKNMDEVLQVQTALNELQGTIESADGRVQWLRRQAAFSTIELTWYQLLQPVAPEEEGTPSFLGRVGNAFTDGGTWMANLLVGLISLWPLWLLITLGIWAWRKTFRVKPARQNP